MIFKILALVELAAFYGTYFAKMLCQRRRGIRTDQMGRGKSRRVKTVELCLKAVTLIVPPAEAAAIFMDVNSSPIWLRCFGAFVGAAGVGVFIASVTTMRDSWRAGIPDGEETALVTRGIYCFSRNPAFLGFDLLYAGVLMMFSGWWLLALSMAAAAMLHAQIVNEESYLAEVFGGEYAEYKSRVRRYLGKK